MTTFLRFKDLQVRGIVASWPSLRYKILHFGFPKGRMLGANTRAWTVEEVQAWLDGLPTDNPRTAAPEREVA